MSKLHIVVTFTDGTTRKHHDVVEYLDNDKRVSIVAEGQTWWYPHHALKSIVSSRVEEEL